MNILYIFLKLHQATVLLSLFVIKNLKMKHFRSLDEDFHFLHQVIGPLLFNLSKLNLAVY